MTGFVRAMVVAALATAVCVAAAADALASRRPTRSERAAITRVGERTPHAGTSMVTVRNIRVSTVGPWASATVTIYFGTLPDEAVDIFHFKRRSWRVASTGTAGEWCVMPVRDQRNLGFPASYPCQ